MKRNAHKKYLCWCLTDGAKINGGREFTSSKKKKAIFLAAQEDHKKGLFIGNWPRRYAVQRIDGGDRKVRVFDVCRDYDLSMFDIGDVQLCEELGCCRIPSIDKIKCRVCEKLWERERFRFDG